jgi:hypothetical protein
MERNDLQNSLFDAICSSVSNASNTPCISINREENLHICLPELKQCCRCCSAANGCTVTAQKWLANFTFMGESSLSGQSFYKWSTNFGGLFQNYYASKDE